MSWLAASGPIADHFIAGTTTRQWRGDDDTLAQTLQLSSPPIRLRQVHGARVIHIDQWHKDVAADGIWSDQIGGPALAVSTADCLPIVVSCEKQSAYGIVHAGWRGLAAGIVDQLIAAIGRPETLHAWLGPAISQRHFEVGDDVRDAFTTTEERHFVPLAQAGKYLASLDGIAVDRLKTLGVRSVSRSHACTFAAPNQWFSYRRDHGRERMTTLVAPKA